MSVKRAWQGAIQGGDDQFAMKRQVVLRTAAQIFSRRGFHQTTLADIADELHIAKPTLYHYFKSKDEILLEVQQAAIQQMLDAPIDPKASGIEQIRVFFHRYVEMIVDDFGTCLIMTGVLPLLPVNQRAVRKGSKSIELILRDMLKPRHRRRLDRALRPQDHGDVPVRRPELDSLLVPYRRRARRRGPRRPGDRVRDARVDENAGLTDHRRTDMKIGDWKAVAGMADVYNQARELGIETNIAEIEAFGFTVIEPEKTGMPKDFASA